MINIEVLSKVHFQEGLHCKIKYLFIEISEFLSLLAYVLIHKNLPNHYIDNLI